MNLTLPANLRLKNVKKFFQAREQLRRIKHHDFVLLYQHNNLAFPRLAIIISKSNVKKAVARNRLKRIIRESFRLQQHSLQEYDIVIKCYHGIASLTNPELHKELNELWKKIIKL
jgi:ribonuclease P protein component